MSHLDTELVEREEGDWVLHLIGTVDSATRDKMWVLEDSEKLLEKLSAAKAETLIIDLTQTERIDSQGLRQFLLAYKQFSPKEIVIKFRNPNAHLKRLFQIMQFDRIFPIDEEDDDENENEDDEEKADELNSRS